MTDWRTTQPERPVTLLDRFAELGNRLINSWWVLVPLGLMCAWALVFRAMGWWK